MAIALNSFPRESGWTVDDLDLLPQDRVRRELLDGVLLVAPSPAPSHQVFAARLMVALEENCPERYHVSQANDVILSSKRLFIPDVLVTTDLAASRDGKFTANEVVLAVEIVAPTSKSMDRILKPSLYAEAGIPHYWRIELRGELTVNAFELDHAGKVYRPAGVFTETIELHEPWPIEIPIARLRPRHL